MHTETRSRVLAAIERNKRARTSGCIFGGRIPSGPMQGARWCERVADYLRDCGAANETLRRLPHGYYVDNFQDATAIACVLQLPARDGSPQYVPAVRDPYNTGAALVDLSDICDSKEDAARAADGMAARYAEEAREDDAKQRAEMLIEDARADLVRLRETHSAICAGLAETDAPASVTNVAHWRLQGIRKEYRETAHLIEKLQANFWASVE